MSDYQVGEKVFVVGRNKHSIAVTHEVTILKFFKRKPDGSDCVTQSIDRVRDSDSRKLFKCYDDAIEHCNILNLKK